MAKTEAKKDPVAYETYEALEKKHEALQAEYGKLRKELQALQKDHEQAVAAAEDSRLVEEDHDAE